MSKRSEDAAVTQAYLRRITGYDVTEVKKEYKVNEDGELELMKKTENVKHVPGDPRAAEFWLTNRLPRRWQKNPASSGGEKEETVGVIEIAQVKEEPDPDKEGPGQEDKAHG